MVLIAGFDYIQKISKLLGFNGTRRHAPTLHLQHGATVGLPLFVNYGTYTTTHPIAKHLGRSDLLKSFLGIYFFCWSLRSDRDFSLYCGKRIGNSALHLRGLVPAKAQQAYNCNLKIKGVME